MKTKDAKTTLKYLEEINNNILVLNQKFKPMKCSNCNSVCGFVPSDFKEEYLKEYLCYECYTSSLDDEKYKELTKTYRREI